MFYHLPHTGSKVCFKPVKGNWCEGLLTHVRLSQAWKWHLGPPLTFQRPHSVRWNTYSVSRKMRHEVDEDLAVFTTVLQQLDQCGDSQEEQLLSCTQHGDVGTQETPGRGTGRTFKRTARQWFPLRGNISTRYSNNVSLLCKVHQKGVFLNKHTIQ